ncbi:MAG TPA: transglycosylase family protein [Pseudonocardia sp.]|nr:transglycosylase family protein [Pseudonocardia sp.]
MDAATGAFQDWFGDTDFHPAPGAPAPTDQVAPANWAGQAVGDPADPADPLGGPTGRFAPTTPRPADDVDAPTGPVRVVPTAPTTAPATDADRGPAFEEPETNRFAAVAPAARTATAVAERPAPVSGRRRRAPEPVRGTGGALARVAVLTVLVALLGGGATALAAGKTVTLIVDGSERTLHTFAPDVGSALAGAGMIATPQDRVSPAPPTGLAHGDQIIVERARLLTLVEGGSERQIWTTANSVDEALRGIGVEVQPIQMSAAPASAIPLAGMALELRIPRAVSLADGTAAPEQLTTTAGTVAALLAERGIELGPDDVSVPAGDTPLTEGTSVQVVRNGIGEVLEIREIPAPEQVIEDPQMPRGEKKVVEQGRPGEQTAIMRVHVQNGQEMSREQVRAGGTTPPQPRVVRVGTNDEVAAEEVDTADGVAPAVSDEATWERLAQCEATGNWSINTGNGYYGGLQFDARTWKAYGGDAYAPLPHQASPGEQMAVASKLRDDRGGYGAWPACSRKLGLPR